VYRTRAHNAARAKRRGRARSAHLRALRWQGGHCVFNMAAYVVVDVRSTDPERAARYRAMSGPSVERHGGRFLARGGAIRVLEGDWVPERLVAIEFAPVEDAQSWFDSEDYRGPFGSERVRVFGGWSPSKGFSETCGLSRCESRR
jgi:uncharacterized protein (DUF1330 family)